MKISYGMLFQNVSDKNGFGYAGIQMVKSLRNLGHEVNFLDSTAPVEVWFAQPDMVKWSGTDYRIMYVPWESTEFLPGWVKAMNEADEVWTPSPVIAEWMKDAGVKKPVYVYQHGVDGHMWRKVRHPVDETFHVFHHGGEAARKGLNEATEIFRNAFAGTDSDMNFKWTVTGWSIPLPGINFIEGKLPIEDLVKLYQKMNLLLYPSWGEGFGLVPIQAMATGLPVLITKGWAPYEHLLPQECLIESELVDSPWPGIHPGKMWKPDIEDAIVKARDMHEHYTYQCGIAEDIADRVRDEYSWDWLTEKAFRHIVRADEARKIVENSLAQ